MAEADIKGSLASMSEHVGRSFAGFSKGKFVLVVFLSIVLMTYATLVVSLEYVTAFLLRRREKPYIEEYAKALKARPQKNISGGDGLRYEREVNYANPLGEPFDYDSAPLKRELPSFRLLELLPGKFRDILRCRIHVYAIEDAPDYEALSYVWGDTAETLGIGIDGHVLSTVSQNARQLLRHLRYEGFSRFVWIDSVCINQADLEERGQQVALMRDIYQRAASVVIWLGPKFDIIGEAWTEIEAHVLADKLIDAGHKLDDDTTIEQIAKEIRETPSWVRTRVTGPYARSIVRERWFVKQNPWFRRSWCVQELALAKDAIIRSRWSTLKWDDFVRGCRSMLSHTQIDPTDSPAWQNNEGDGHDFVRALMRIRHRRSTGNPGEDLLDMLCMFKDRRATLPADKIFSLLGLIPGVEALGLVPDYHASVAEVYRKAAVLMLKCSDNLDALCAANCIPGAKMDDGYEVRSWVSDWRSQIPMRAANNERTQRVLTANEVRTTRRALQAIGNAEIYASEMLNLTTPVPFRSLRDGRVRPNLATPGSVAKVRFDDDETTLILEGHIYDELAEVGDLSLNLADLRTQYRYDKFDDAAMVLIEMVRGALAFTSRVAALLQWEQVARLSSEDDAIAREFFLTLNGLPVPSDTATPFEKKCKEYYRSLRWLRRLHRWGLFGADSGMRLLALVFITHAMWKDDTPFTTFNGLLWVQRRRLARTKSGHLALVPGGAVAGDKLALCKGGKLPLLVRPRNDGDWTLVGEGYMPSVMDGKVFKEKECEDIRLR